MASKSSTSEDAAKGILMTGLMKKRGENKTFFTGKHPVEVRLFVLDGTKMELKYSKKDEQNFKAINLTAVTEVKQTEDSWFVVKVPHRKYEFCSSVTDTSLQKRGDWEGPYDAKTWVMAIRDCIRQSYRELETADKVIEAQNVEVARSSLGHFSSASSSLTWEPKIMQLSQLKWRILGTPVEIDLRKVGDMHFAEYPSLGIAQLNFDTYDGRHAFRMPVNQGKKCLEILQDCRKNILGIHKSGMMEKQHTNSTSKWSLRQVMFDNKNFYYSACSVVGKNNNIPLQNIRTCKRNQMPGSFYVDVPLLKNMKGKGGKSRMNFRVAETDDYNKDAANKIADEWVEQMQNAIQRVADSLGGGSGISSGGTQFFDDDGLDSEPKHFKFTHMTTVQSHHARPGEELQQGHNGTLCIAKADGVVVFAPYEKAIDGYKTSHGKMSEIARVSELKLTLEEFLKSSGRRRSTMSNTKAMKKAQADGYFSVHWKRGGQDQNLSVRVTNDREGSRFRNVFGQIVGVSKTQEVLKELELAIDRVDNGIKQKTQEAGEDPRVILQMDFAALADKLRSANKSIDNKRAVIIQVARAAVHKYRLSGTHATIDEKVIADDVHKVLNRKFNKEAYAKMGMAILEAAREALQTKHDDVSKQIASKAHSTADEHSGVETQDGMRDRLSRMRARLRKIVVEPVMKLLASEICKGSKVRMPPGIIKIATLLEITEESRNIFVKEMGANYTRKFKGSGIAKIQSRYDEFNSNMRLIHHPSESKGHSATYLFRIKTTDKEWQDQEWRALFHIQGSSPFKDPGWKVYEAYATEFVYQTQIDIKQLIQQQRVARQNHEDMSKEDQLDNNASMLAGGASKDFENILDELCNTDGGDDDTALPPPVSWDKDSHEKMYYEFKGQLVTLFETSIDCYAKANGKGIRSFIEDKCKVTEKWPISKSQGVFKDCYEILREICNAMKLIQKVGPGKPLFSLLQELLLTPDADDAKDKRPRGALHAYAEALALRLPGALTASLEDDIVNETVFVVFNTAATMINELEDMRTRVEDNLLAAYQEREEINVDGVLTSFYKAHGATQQRLLDEMVMVVDGCMIQKDFVDSFQKPEDPAMFKDLTYKESKQLRGAHLFPIFMRISRRVVPIKQAVRRSPEFFCKLVLAVVDKMPMEYMQFLIKNCSPLPERAATKALSDTEAWAVFLKELLRVGEDNQALEKLTKNDYLNYFKKRAGQRALALHESRVEKSIKQASRILHVAQAVNSWTCVRKELIKGFPEETRWLREEDEESADAATRLTRKEITHMKEVIRPKIEMLLQLKNYVGNSRKHVLYQLGLMPMDRSEQVDTGVEPLNKPRTRSTDKASCDYTVSVNIAGYTYHLLKVEDEFKKLEDKLKAVDPLMVFTKPPWSILKSHEKLWAPAYAAYLKMVLRKFPLACVYEFVESMTRGLKAHVVGRESDLEADEMDASNSTRSSPRRRSGALGGKIIVHVTHNNQFEFPRVPYNKILVLKKNLEREASRVGMALSEAAPLDTSDARAREVHDQQHILNQAITLYDTGNKKMVTAIVRFFGQTLSHKLGLLPASSTHT